MFKNFLQILFIIASFWMSTVSAQMEPILVINMKDDYVLPRNFRTVQDPYKITGPNLPTREGLDSLKISGSGQFSKNSLKKIINSLPRNHRVIVVDLRQESHGFFNGTAVSWYGMRDWANVGKRLGKIKQEEKSLLEQSLQKKNVVLNKIINKGIQEHEDYETVSIPFTIHHASTEERLVQEHDIDYFRIPLTDHITPAYHLVDRFIEFVQQLPHDTWLHFHCSAGIGRTTTLMTMYDMMKNAKKVTFDDIMKRQWYIGGRNMELANSRWSASYQIDRLQFLKEFYDYCRTNNDQFQTTWSLYVLRNM